MARLRLVHYVLFCALVLQTEARVKIMSSYNDTTIYSVRERPVIMNIDIPTKGMLLLANPTNACGPVTPPPIPQTFHLSTVNDSDNNSQSLNEDPIVEDFTLILLVSWSSTDCSLRVKTEYAYAAGYSVLLLQDPSSFDNDSEPFSPLAPLTSQSIPFDYGWTDASVYACIINSDDWEILKSNFTSDAFYVIFEDSSSVGSWFKYMIVGILAIGAVLFTIGLSYVLIQLLVLILLWIRESIVARIQQIRRDRRRRLPASQLKKIPIQQWNSDTLQDICSICLESFVVADLVRILPCSHVFHQSCIDPWLLKQRRKCPNCKRKIVFPDENRDSDSSSDDERTPLLRRSSSGRESNASVGTHQRDSSQSRSEGSRFSHQHGSGRFHSAATGVSPNAQSVVGINSQIHPPVDNSINFSSSSSANASSEFPDSATQGTHGQPDLKDKVNQLCARMENVGRKIKKKVKVAQASKLENDSSSDMSTSIQPVLVTVTVESNPNNSDTDCEQTPKPNESHLKDNLSTSSSHQEPCSKPELQVKVVPECTTAGSSLTLCGNDNAESGARDEHSISPDLNA